MGRNNSYKRQKSYPKKKKRKGYKWHQESFDEHFEHTPSASHSKKNRKDKRRSTKDRINEIALLELGSYYITSTDAEVEHHDSTDTKARG